MSELARALELVEDVLDYVGCCPVQQAFDSLEKVHDILKEAISKEGQ